jgi:hypothetical protein
VAPEAPGEGLMPQEPHHRLAAKRIRSFAKKMRSSPTDAEAAMWRLLRDRRANSNFVAKSHSKSTFWILFALKRSLSLKSTVASTLHRTPTPTEMPIWRAKASRWLVIGTMTSFNNGRPSLMTSSQN